MIGRYLFLVQFVLSGLSIATPSVAQEPTIAEFEITGSEVRTIESTVLGRTYDLYIKLPPGYTSVESTDKQYPVIFFNDGSYNWLTAVGVTRAPFSLGGYEPAILVGLSYAKGERVLQAGLEITHRPIIPNGSASKQGERQTISPLSRRK